MFTFWDYKRNRWPRDAGLRLDHLLLSPAVAPRLIKAGVDRKLRGEEGASDHAPAWIVLRRLKDVLRSAALIQSAAPQHGHCVHHTRSLASQRRRRKAPPDDRLREANPAIV